MLILTIGPKSQIDRVFLARRGLIREGRQWSATDQTKRATEMEPDNKNYQISTRLGTRRDVFNGTDNIVNCYSPIT